MVEKLSEMCWDELLFWNNLFNLMFRLIFNKLLKVFILFQAKIYNKMLSHYDRVFKVELISIVLEK